MVRERKKVGKHWSRASVFPWAQHFKAGKSDIPDNRDESTERRVSNAKGIAAIENVEKKDNRVTIDFTAQEVGISSSSVQRVLRKDLGLRKLSSRRIPLILTPKK